MPVDRHVERVSKRIGLIPPKATADQAHDLFLGLLEPDQMYAAHVILINHGRETCHAQNPKHDLCPVATAAGSSTARRPDRSHRRRTRRTEPVTPAPRRSSTTSSHADFDASPVAASGFGLTEYDDRLDDLSADAFRARDAYAATYLGGSTPSATIGRTRALTTTTRSTATSRARCCAAG